MKKKTIKYLILITLIALALIIIPISNIVADGTEKVTVTYNTFKTSKNHYCLNKGDRFLSSVDFTVEEFSKEKFEEVTENDNVDDNIENVLKYIISEANKTNGDYANKIDINSYIPQKAIWKLVNPSLTYTDADVLIANAEAYAKFPNVIPTVEKYEDNGIAIKYYVATSSTGYGNGSYTNLLFDTINVTGATYSRTENVGGGYYKKIYTKNSGATEVTVSFDYEMRTVDNLSIYTTEQEVEREVIEIDVLDEVGKFFREGDLIWCRDCENNVQDPCFELTSDTDLGILDWQLSNCYGQSVDTEIVKYFIDQDFLNIYKCCNEHFYLIGTFSYGNNTFYYRFWVDEDNLRILNEQINDDDIKNKTIKEPMQNLLYGTGSVTTDDVKKTIPFIKPVTLNFNKTDFSGSGNSVSGATLNIEGVTNVGSLSASSITIGSGSVTVTPASGNSGTFKIKLTENAPTGYKAIPETELTVTYNDGTVTNIGSNQDTYVPDSTSSSVTVKNRPSYVELTFNKKDFGTKLLPGAVIKVTGYEKVSKIEGRDDNNNLKDTNNDGIFDNIKVYTSDDSGTFKLQIEETTAPTGYKGLPEIITLTVNYNIYTGDITGISSNKYSEYFSRDNSTVTIKNRPAVELTFNKKDFGTKLLPGAEIKVTGDTTTVSAIKEKGTKNNLSNNILKDTNNDGTFDTITVYPTQSSYDSASNKIGEFKLTIEEITAPTGYQKMPEKVTLTVRYNIETGAVEGITDKNEANEDSVYITSSESTVTVKNQPKLNNLKIVKKDSLTNNPISDVTFKIELTGVHSITGYSGTPSTITATTDPNGEINLNGIVLATNATQITAKITETAVPYTKENQHPDGYYYKVDSTPIEMTMTYSNGAWSVSGGSTTGTSISSENATISGRDVSITIKNQPYITIDGRVWNDGQTGVKGNVQGPNGIKDSTERGLEGVYVRLCDVLNNNNLAAYDYTDANGAYSFVDIPKTNEGYRIVFNYDGINYQETSSLGNAGKDSKIYVANKINNEDNYEYYKAANSTTRTDFNNRFKTISAGTATGTYNGATTTTPLSYTYNKNDNISILNVRMDGTNPANTNQDGIDDKDFQMRARTGVYYSTTSNVDCGLVKKEFDLSIGTDVKEATLKINDKETKYDYAQIMNGEMQDLTLDSILQNNSSSKEDVNYNLYLYTSDYYYRINDYATGIRNDVSENVYDYTSDSTNTLKELEAYVTYSVILKNQTTKNATVNRFVYHYDSAYEPQFVVNKVIDGYKVESIANNTITFVSNGSNELSEANSYRKEINLTFKVKPNSDGNITTKTATNIAEITEYYTEQGGLIDKDSAPGNANVRFDNLTGTPKVRQYEDDTDEARGLDIVIRTDDTRKITGTVFADSDKNGTLDNGETKVNDVIVQLIEIKEINDKYYEYIWQETKSGSNIVETTARNGYTGVTYRYLKATGNKSAGTREYVVEDEKQILNMYVEQEELNGDGQYKFTDFIPGNYIIRYIYGDGTKVIRGTILENVDVDGELDSENKEPLSNWNVTLYSVTENKDIKTITTNENGEYEFTDYVPGVYKIKYTYNGEQKVIDAVESKSYEEKQKIYNGQDYKSTIDSLYKAEWYNTANYGDDYSIARDNEARRLEVMAYSTTINEHIGESLNAKTNDALEATWMCAETSKINIPVDAYEKTADSIPAGSSTTRTILNNTVVAHEYVEDKETVVFNKMNFGLAVRPNTNIVLEKHITALKITPSGTGVQSIVDAKAESIENIVNGTDVQVKGVTTGLATIKSTQSNRGFWQVATDVEELMQGAELEVEYTYVLRNDSEKDYLSQFLVSQYTSGIDDGSYNTLLRNKAREVKVNTKGKTNEYGNYLGQFYYTGEVGGSDVLVQSRVEVFEEAINNDLLYDAQTSGIDFVKVNDQAVEKLVYDVDGNEKTEQIDTVIQNTSKTTFLLPKQGETYTVQTEDTEASADWSRTIKLRTTLATVSGGELGANIPSYIAEIVQYSNAAGRKDMSATPANLTHVHSDDTTKTMLNWEQDEFWGESIIITKPTGEDKLAPLQIALITISALATLGVGIVLIKKFALKK